MIRLILTMLLMLSASAAHALTVVHSGPVSAVIADQPGTCQPLPDYQAWPKYPAGPVYVLPGADLHLQIQPSDDSGSLDYAGKAFWAGFLPDDASGNITLAVAATGSAGLIDAIIAGSETIKIADKPGTLFLRMLEPHGDDMSMISAISIPVLPYPTATRLP